MITLDKVIDLVVLVYLVLGGIIQGYQAWLKGHSGKGPPG